jgi:hypothetical protein
MINIETQQQYIIDSINEERQKTHKFDLRNPFREAVYFEPSYGRFLFDDGYIRYEVIEPLIADGTLVYKEFAMHQGDKMLKYVLG